MSHTTNKSIALHRKALELCEMSRKIAAYVCVNKDLIRTYQSNSHRDIIINSMVTDAILIPQKIKLAERSNSRAIKMSSIRFVNIMSKNILSYCNGLEKDGLKEKEYLHLLKSEIKSFRKSFLSWRQALC